MAEPIIICPQTRERDQADWIAGTPL